MAIDPTTKLLGLIGDPVEHSLSPAMQNFIFKKLNLNYCYLAFRVNAEELKHALEGIRALRIAGVNVTVPHKQSVIRFLDELDHEANILKAVNTIKNTDGKLIGYNTDGIGFRRSLKAQNIKLSGKRAVVLGAGGAARAAVYSLIMLGIGPMIIYNRTLSRAKELADEMRASTGFKAIHGRELDDDQLLEDLQSAQLLVNATSVGMHPDVHSSPIKDVSALHAGLFVYDLIYNPAKTKLLQDAEKQGARILNGLDMLIYQGIESLKIWTGVEIKEAPLKELKDYLAKSMR